MSESETPAQDDVAALRKRLLNRVAVAGVIIVGLLAGLAAFDALTTHRPEPERAEELPPPKPLAQALPETPRAAEAPAAEEKPTAEEKPAAAEGKVQPAVPERSAAPEAAPLPEPKGVRPLTVPATPKQALHQLSPAPAPAPIAAAPAPGTIAHAIAAARHYLVQLGVFSNPVNAEELRAKLEQNGIPARIESRVEVGPFATRREAEAARQKLVALGIAPGIIVTLKK